MMEARHSSLDALRAAGVMMAIAAHAAVPYMSLPVPELLWPIRQRCIVHGETADERRTRVAILAGSTYEIGRAVDFHGVSVFDLNARR